MAFYPETKAAFLQIDGKSLHLPKRFSLTSQRVPQGRRQPRDEGKAAASSGAPARRIAVQGAVSRPERYFGLFDDDARRRRGSAA